MNNKNYNTLGQKKLDMFISFLIDNKIIKSKSEFAEKIFESKENLNNLLHRNKILNEEKIILISNIFNINPLYFTNDSIEISNNPLKDHPSLAIIEKQFEEKINNLNVQIDDMNEKILQLENMYKKDKDAIIKEYTVATTNIWKKMKENQDFIISVANNINLLDIHSNWIMLLKEKLKDILSYFLNLSINDTYELINDVSKMVEDFNYVNAYKSYTSMLNKLTRIDKEHEIISFLHNHIKQITELTKIYHVYDYKVSEELLPLQDEIEELIIKNKLSNNLKDDYINNTDLSFLDLDYMYSMNIIILYKNFISNLINYQDSMSNDSSNLFKNMILELKRSAYSENNEFVLPSFPKTAEKLYLNVINNILDQNSFKSEIKKHIEIVDKNILLCKKILELFKNENN